MYYFPPNLLRKRIENISATIQEAIIPLKNPNKNSPIKYFLKIVPVLTKGNILHMKECSTLPVRERIPNSFLGPHTLYIYPLNNAIGISYTSYSISAKLHCTV